jgi:hypothetical protein
MATKAPQVTKITTSSSAKSNTATPAVPVATQADSFAIVVNSEFLAGNTAYYSYNGKTLPVLVKTVNPSLYKDGDGYYVTYNVVADLDASYPAGVTRGPFRNVSGSTLSSR